MLMAGVPVAVHANHGPATISTKVSTTSLRHTKATPQRVLDGADAADDDPLGDRRDARGHGADRGEDHAAEGGGLPDARALRRCHARATSDADAEGAP